VDAAHRTRTLTDRFIPEMNAYLTAQLLRRAVHTSMQSLEQDVRDWIAQWNEGPKPFVRKKTAEEILDSLARHLQRISGAPH
jgi:hypothetical protein